MTDYEKIEIARQIVGDDESLTEEIAILYLSFSKEMVLNRMNTTLTEVPTRYEYLQCRLMAEMYLRRGAEGETHHNENGISRDFHSASFEDILCEISPEVRIMR